MYDVKVKIKRVSRHRNGVGGVPFTAVLFECEENGPMVASIFDSDGMNPRCAVYSVVQLVLGTVHFRVNSWRGDVYFCALLDAGLKLDED